MSAASVSRTGLPFSQLSAIASTSRFSSIASATLFSTLERSVVDAFAPAGLRCGVGGAERELDIGRRGARNSVNGSPVAGVRFSLYSPVVGATIAP